MKTILFTVLIFPVFLFGQTNEVDQKAISFFYVGKPEKIDTVVYKIENTGKELMIYKKWREYEPGYGLGISCAVFGCNSDHKVEVRIREVYGVGLDRNIYWIRTDTAYQIFEEKKKTITETITKWSFE